MGCGWWAVGCGWALCASARRVTCPRDWIWGRAGAGGLSCRRLPFYHIVWPLCACAKFHSQNLPLWAFLLRLLFVVRVRKKTKENKINKMSRATCAMEGLRKILDTPLSPPTFPCLGFPCLSSRFDSFAFVLVRRRPCNGYIWKAERRSYLGWEIAKLGNCEMAKWRNWETARLKQQTEKLKLAQKLKRMLPRDAMRCDWMLNLPNCQMRRW